MRPRIASDAAVLCIAEVSKTRFEDSLSLSGDEIDYVPLVARPVLEPQEARRPSAF